jgi:hypothetical protein
VNGVFDWVRAATVAITDGGAQIGSGFFVAPGWVLSCAHVVATARAPRVRWKDHDLAPAEITCRPAVAGPGHGFDFPDTAVLRVDVPESSPPCVPIGLEPPTPGRRVWATGISRIRIGALEPFSAVLTVADAGPGLIRLQGGQLGLGMSGGPVLDLQTYTVCGITKAIQHEATALGGWAVPLADALAIVDDPLADLNEKYHSDSLRALCERQAAYGRLPTKVLTLFRDHRGATDLLIAHLEGIGFTPPPTLGDEQRPEWAVRRLFDLSLDQLVYALSDLRDNLASSTALAVFDHVACCVALAHEPAWWITGEAAHGLRAEAARSEPRVIRICTDEEESVRALMRRAFEGRPFDIIPAGGPSSARAVGADTLDDIRAEILHRAGATEEEWASEPTRREDFRRRFRSQYKFLKVRVDATLDTAHVADLLRQFPGLLFLVSKRQLTIPAGVENVLLDLAPPIDRRTERLSVNGRADLLQHLGAEELR